MTEKPTEDDKQGFFSNGLKSGRSLPQVKGLIQYEIDLVRIVMELRFRKVKNVFQKMLGEDVKKVQTSKKTRTPVDKTFSMCRLNKNDYQNLLRNAIATTYKKANKNIGAKINKKSIEFAKQVRLDKIEINGPVNSCVTLKDHKENFMNHPMTRLISPSKNEEAYLRPNKHKISKLSVTNKCNQVIQEY